MTSARFSRRDVVALAGLLVAGVGVPLWMAAAAGAVGIPTNDDWVYMRAATALFGTGAVDMPGHTAAFIGQLVLVQPFLWLSAGDPWAFTAFGLFMTSIGIAATYLLARRYVGRGSAVLVVLSVVAFPGFARESASFMTDVPAYALAMVCLLLGTAWLQGDGGRWTLVASLGAGVLAVSVREFAIAAPVAILLAAWARDRVRRPQLVVRSSVLIVGLAGVLAISVWLVARSASQFQFGRSIDLGPAFATLAAILLPAMVLYVAKRTATFSAIQVIVSAAIVLLLCLPNGPIVGNLWTADGLAANQLLPGVRDPVFGALPWAVSGRLALFAAILAATAALSWTRIAFASASSASTARLVAVRIAGGREGLLVLFMLGYAAEVVLYSSVGGVFDRYLYPLVPVAAITLLRAAQPLRFGRSHAFAHGAFVWLVVSAVMIAANSFAYDAARYRAGTAAVAMGYDATTVDAGYEWIGLHGRGTENLDFDPASPGWWWEDIWPSFRRCAVLSNTPLDLAGYTLIRGNHSAYRQYLFLGPDEPLYLYGASLDGCPRPPLPSG